MRFLDIAESAPDRASAWSDRRSLPHASCAHGEAVAASAEPERAGFAPLPEWTQPLVWTPQGKRPVHRFFAHLLIRLLVLSPMPIECQAWVFFFPTSLLWSLTPPSISPGAPAEPAKSGTPGPADPATSPLTESPGEASCGGADPTGVVTLLSLTDLTKPRITGTIPNIGGRLAFGENGALLFGTAKSAWGGDTELGGVRTAALGKTPIIRLSGQNPFGVDNAYRSEVELRASFSIVGGGEDVETAEVDLLRDGARVEGIPVTREGGGWACTIPRGKTFNPDSDWQLAFVANRSRPTEMRAAPKRLRPAWLEFGGTAEAQNETQLDLIKLFNPTPRLSLRAASEPGGGRRVSMRVAGDVVSSLGPVDRVAIDGRTVPVTQTGSGPDGTGPFEGSFTADVSLGPQTTLILAHAMNGLGNLASHALVVTPVTDAQGQIVERTIQEESPLSPLEQEPSDYAFRVDLKDRGQVGASVKIGIDSGVETKVVVLRRQGSVFRGDPLYLVPENFVAPSGMPEELQGRVVRGRLGLQPKVIYAQNIKEEAALTGALLVDAASGAPIDAVEPSDSSAVRQTLRLVVGASGDAGDELTATLQSLGGDLREAAQVLGAPVNQPVRLVRQSADPEAAGYNLFVSTTPILPVYTREAVERPGTAAHGVVGTGFLRLSAADLSTIEPVGVPAETAQWVVEDVRPVFAEPAGMRAASGEGGDERQLRFFDVVVSAVVHGAAATVPALALAMAFDAAADLAGEISDIRQVVPVGETYEEVPFPAETTADGKTYVRIRMQVARYQDLGPGQRLKGVTLRALDFGGGSVRDLLVALGSAASPPLAIQSALVASGLAPLTTRFVAGMTAAGMPQSVEAVVGQIIREVYTPIAKVQPVYPLVVETLRAGYALDGQSLSEQELADLAVALMVGGGLGGPLGFLQAVYDDLNLFAQLRDLSQLLYYAVLADQALSRVKWLAIAGAIQFVISEEFRQQITERFTRMAPVLLEAARVAVHPEVLQFFGTMVVRSFYQGYETALHPYIPWMGMQHGTRTETSFLIGFMMGHIGGYVAEIAATLFASGLITAGIGAAIVAVTKANKVGKAAKAVSVVRRLSVLPYREANAVEKVAKIILDWLKMVGNIEEGKLAGFLDHASLVGREEDLLQLVERYGLDVEVLDSAAGIRLTRVEALARALSGTEETAQVALRLAEITRRRVRVGNELRPLVFTEEGLEKAAKGLDNLILAVKGGHVQPAFVERILNALDDEASVAAALGKLQGTDAFIHQGDMLESFLRAVSSQWDGATFSQLERLMNRWTTTQPPTEAVLDIVSMIAKYGKQLDADGPVATARIVRQLDRFDDDSVDVVRRLLALDKSYAQGGNYPGLSEVDLAWFVRNMESPDLGADISVLEALVSYTRTTPNEDDTVGPATTLLRHLQHWRDNGPDPAEDLVRKVQGALANKDAGDIFRRLEAGRVDADLRVTDPETGLLNVLDTVVTADRDVVVSVRVLRNGAVATEQWTLRAGELAAVEAKGFKYTSWTFQSSIDTATDEVRAGFRHVDPLRRGSGLSLLATTPDLEAHPDRMRKVLESLASMGEDAFSDRGAIIMLPRDGQGYTDWAYWVIRHCLNP